MNNNKDMLIGGLVLGIIIIAILLAGDASIERQNTLTSSGSAEITTEPDKAEIFVMIETIELTAEQSKDKNAELSDRVIEALKTLGINEEGIESTSFNLYRKERYISYDREPVFEGYALEHVIKITTTNIEETGTIVDTAVNNGANAIQGVTFTLTKEKEKEVKAQALEKAAGEAKEKANALAKSLNVKLGDIQSVSESQFYFRPFAAQGVAYDAVEEAALNTKIIAGDVDVSATVTIIYKIKQ